MKCAILLAAFGAASHEARDALAGIDARVRKRFPGMAVRWAYTSPILRERIARTGRKSDSVRKAMLRLAFEGFAGVAVQPLQAIAGSEYSRVLAAARECAGIAGIRFSIGSPLLSTGEDMARAALALVGHLPVGRNACEDVVFMGHGARHPAQSRYTDLADAVGRLDARVHVGTMNGEIMLEHILPRLRSRRVWLMPLLCVAGRHAQTDMAGPGSASWLRRIEAAGHKCVPVMSGLAGHEGFAAIWLDHLDDCLRRLSTNHTQNAER